jgi:hypothetical protein
MYKTYASKYRTSKRKIIAKYRIDKDFGIKYQNSKGEEKIRIFYNQGFKRQKKCSNKNPDLVPESIINIKEPGQLIKKIKAGKCEICGNTKTPIEIHHIRKLKNLKNQTFWEKLMISKRRKSLAICKKCHVNIHCEC